MVDSKEYLAKLYNQLGSLKSDFRNFNLTHLIVTKVVGNSILDVGCGNGILLGMLDKRRKIGIEPNDELINLSKKINPNLNIKKGYGEDIDILIKEKVDCILMIDVLEHINDDNLQIGRVFNHLTVGGQFILVVPAHPSLYGKRDKNNGHYRRYSKKELLNKLIAKGFLIKEVRYWNMLGFLPYFFYEKILRKELNTDLRTTKKKGVIKRLINVTLNLWFKYIENNFNSGFGLSIICVAEKR